MARQMEHLRSKIPDLERFIVLPQLVENPLVTLGWDVVTGPEYLLHLSDPTPDANGRFLITLLAETLLQIRGACHKVCVGMCLQYHLNLVAIVYDKVEHRLSGFCRNLAACRIIIKERIYDNSGECCRIGHHVLPRASRLIKEVVNNGFGLEHGSTFVASNGRTRVCLRVLQ